VTATLDASDFRMVLGHFPTGVVVVTAVVDGEPVGMTIGSFTSVSLEPPLVAFLPAKSSSTFERIRTAGSFCVNVLAADQEAECLAFAARDGTRFAGLDWEPADSGAPVLSGAMAWIDCSFEEIREAGDHYIVIGAVRGLAAARAALPLVFFQGGYGRFTGAVGAAQPGPDLIAGIATATEGQEELVRLAADLGARCNLMVRSGDQLIVVSGAHELGLDASYLGRRLPFVPPFGAVFAAFGPPNNEDAWMEQGPTDGSALDDLRRRLDRVRVRGWSVALSSPDYASTERELAEFSAGELPPARARALQHEVRALVPHYETELLSEDRQYHVRTLAAPVPAGDGTARLMLSVHHLPQPMSSQQIHAVADRLTRAARAIADLAALRSPNS
jgi:flavin reductase (DIM6/NTAB) family NADH-FMN oxidoreductase RutF/DNA-binding IclR family transcriptional regulator